MTSAEGSLVGVSKIKEKIGVLFELLKFRLASLIAFSGAMGYSLGAKEVEFSKLVLFVFASIGITGAANIINQILEKDLDRMMKRTASRPLPSGRITNEQAAIWAVILGVTSLFIFISVFNLSTGLISLLSLVLYGFVYTPLKRVGPIAVFVGAFPGAFPPMIGWVAATNHFGLEPGILFAIQFFWQFPHFWAIAWVLDEDYKRAGFKLLPANGLKDLDTTMQIMIYTLFLLPIGWLPYKLGMTGINSAFIATIFGVLFLAQTFHLMRTCTDKTARQLMFGSFIYLPIVQIAFLLDKI
jgi:protoheme IX farnesyltransferase